MEPDEIKTADLFALPPGNWWARWVCRVIGARTFHWGMFITRDDRGWVITESTGKGVALTRFNYSRAYVYRIKDTGDIRWEKLIGIVADYGNYPYDWDVAFETAIWWLLKHYLGKLIPRWYDKEVNCQEWVVQIADELGIKLIPDDEYPMCTNLENSSFLQLVGEMEQRRNTGGLQKKEAPGGK